MTTNEAGEQVHPLARTDLDINEVDDGLVMYDVVTDRVHYLNVTASVVFVECTGDNDEAAIASLVQQTFGLDAPPLLETRECLESLQVQGLLQNPS